MFSIFHKILSKKSNTESFDITIQPTLPMIDNDGWISPLPAVELLKSELRQKYLNVLWQQVSMTQDMFSSLYQKPIERYAEMVQLLPASEAHHHSHLGGMLDHGLEVLSFAAKLRQSYVLPPNAAPEEQSKQRDAWSAAIIYQALVHDIGKIIVDIEIQLKNGSRWFAWHGIPPQPYKFKYIKGRDYELHPVLGSYLANYLIPQEAFDWLAQYPEAFSSLMYAMAGHSDKAGLLSEIVQKADQNSVTLAIGGDITKLTQRPVTSFAKQLILALRHLLQHKLKINTPKGPADGWYTNDGLWLMSKSTADQIRAYLLEQGISVPSDNPKLFSEMQSLNIVESTPDNTAIWHCRIKADSGWCPPKAFTLLKIKPEIIWENVNDRPEFFAGEVYVEAKNNDSKEICTTESAISEQNLLSSAEPTKETADNLIQNEIQSVPETKVKDNADMADFVLGLFDGSVQASSFEDEAQNMESNKESSEKSLEIKSTEEKTLATQKPDTISGKAFIDWLKLGISTKKLAINVKNAKLHIVKGHLFLVSPGIFQDYYNSLNISFTKKDIENLQYAFQDLKLHKKYHLPNKDSQNFWKCSVAGPRKSSKLVGYLIKDTEYFFGNQILIDNLHLTLIEEIQNE
ncbi:MobH family relaxase [Aggregatibacter actinomycetemcomitans]|uniref:MobH family relaxase n=1 Tax=Aggregatibacter actinomycetemcomitans TaxID=714 RepID=UPI000D647F95|nr:MobH family relaxase [Aggregatibacter actinomycetemcomitans]TYA23446.1 relaxase [Aggregatibacter actinomycetemcomitans]TYA28593.1 relaxase [Aggregatibacter actinomycetemcomitans]